MLQLLAGANANDVVDELIEAQKAKLPFATYKDLRRLVLAKRYGLKGVKVGALAGAGVGLARGYRKYKNDQDRNKRILKSTVKGGLAGGAIGGAIGFVGGGAGLFKRPFRKMKKLTPEEAAEIRKELHDLSFDLTALNPEHPRQRRADIKLKELENRLRKSKGNVQGTRRDIAKLRADLAATKERLKQDQERARKLRVKAGRVFWPEKQD
jgi:hypothetical protein